MNRSEKQQRAILAPDETAPTAVSPLDGGHPDEPCEPDCPGHYCPLVWHCTAEGLHPNLLRGLRIVASEFEARTGSTIRIVSGRRTLRRQAELMAELTDGQLEGMYCRNGYPSYIRDLVARRREAGSIGPEDAYRILANRSEGYISSHLYGAAVDITPMGPYTELLKSILATRGFAVLDERSLGVDCIHASCKDIPRRIVRT